MSPHTKIPYTKSPISFKEQVDKLALHGLEVPDPTVAEFYLSQLNYYRFAAYCVPFEQDHATHRFRSGIRFDDVLNLYTFDRELRLLVLDAIERFEVSLRTQMAYQLSQRHNSAHPHLKPEIFGNQGFYDASVRQLSREIENSTEEFIRHLMAKYAESLPPIWAAVELMTMGQLSKWFSNIKERSDRQAIAQIYGVDEKILRSFCKHLTLIRNTCAHHGRLWNRDFVNTMTLPNKGPVALRSGLQRFAENDRRKRKLYNALVMLGFLMDTISPGHHWKQRLKQLIDAHRIDTRPMGFPDDWQSRVIWKNS